LLVFFGEPANQDVHVTALGQFFIGLAHLSGAQSQARTDLFHIRDDRSGFVGQLPLSKLLRLAIHEVI
jgi:hypothetical protein